MIDRMTHVMSHVSFDSDQADVSNAILFSADSPREQRAKNERTSVKRKKKFVSVNYSYVEEEVSSCSKE